MEIIVNVSNPLISPVALVLAGKWVRKGLH